MPTDRRPWGLRELDPTFHFCYYPPTPKRLTNFFGWFREPPSVSSFLLELPASLRDPKSDSSDEEEQRSQGKEGLTVGCDHHLVVGA